MKRTRDDIVAKIEMARDEARIKAHPYMNLTIKSYNYWRAVAAIAAYDKALTMFMRGTEHRIPDMATEAIAKFERARDGDTTERTLALTDGRRDALATVADWMNTEERWTK